MKIDIIRAWKDRAYRESLSDEERASLPENPVGQIELTEAELEKITGAGSWHCGGHSDWHCGGHSDWHCGGHSDWHCGGHSDWHCGGHSDWHCGGHSHGHCGHDW